MKKDIIFTPIMLVVGALLFLYDFIGKPAHIAIAVAGVLVLAVYTAATKKEWKIPALEIIMRVFYGVALISGIVIMNIEGIVALEIAHKACAVIFLASLVALFIHKIITANKNK